MRRREKLCVSLFYQWKRKGKGGVSPLLHPANDGGSMESVSRACSRRQTDGSLSGLLFVSRINLISQEGVHGVMGPMGQLCRHWGEAIEKRSGPLKVFLSVVSWKG